MRTYTVTITMEIAVPADLSANNVGDFIDDDIWRMNDRYEDVAVRECIVFCNDVKKEGAQ